MSVYLYHGPNIFPNFVSDTTTTATPTTAPRTEQPIDQGMRTIIIAELLCGRRPQEWSPIPILRGVLKGMLAIFYGHWQAE